VTTLRSRARTGVAVVLTALAAAHVSIAAEIDHLACPMPPHECSAPAISRCCCAADTDSANRAVRVTPIVRTAPAQPSVPVLFENPGPSVVPADCEIPRAPGPPPDFPILLANLRL